jgi:myo-inositol-1-phosphate synthase
LNESKDYAIKPAEGRLGVVIPGMGAVSTTLMAGVFLSRKGLKSPKGSLTQLAHIKIRSGNEEKSVKISDFVPLANLDDIVFGGWDIFNESAYESATHAKVLTQQDIDLVKDELDAIKPWKAVFFPEFVKRLEGSWVKTEPTKYDLALAVIKDIETFKKEKNLSRIVMIWCGSTEIYQEVIPGVHDSIENFEKALRDSHPAIAPSMIYAYAAIKTGSPFMNGAPNLCVEAPALKKLADREKVCIGGRDFKSGQTMMKTILAPGLKARMLGLDGWYSTNILGNRDGEVLDDPESFKTKEKSKLSVLDSILQPDKYPDLYGNYSHVVRINYYPPRGDNKEGWDNIDIAGWLDYKMQIKIDFLCRDSILAAPIALDLLLFFDFAQRAGLYGNQEWLSFYWKSPMHPDGQEPLHDLFMQAMKMRNKLRELMNSPVVSEYGCDTYE